MKQALTETAKFAHMFDYFFDCLNVLIITEGTPSRNLFSCHTDPMIISELRFVTVTVFIVNYVKFL